MLLNQRHPVHDLIQQELRTKGAELFPALEPATIRFALACAGAGLDHTLGEQALVLEDDSLKGKFEMFTLVTDRRVCGRWAQQPSFNVQFAHAGRVQPKKGVLSAKIHVQMAAESGAQPVETIEAGSNFDHLVRFLNKLLTVPGLEREPSHRPLCAPSPGDPTGAQTAHAWLGQPDDRTSYLLSFVHAAHESGRMPTAIATDLVARIVLHHRNLTYGRGMTSGRLMSPVSMDDLSNAFVMLYGNPFGHAEEPVRTLDFDSRLRTQTGKALASSALGLASTALLGVGWTQTARKRADRFRLLVADTGCFSSFRLQDGRGVGLHMLEPELVYEVDVKLLGIEDDILSRRVAFGWNLDTAALLAEDPTDVDQVFRDVLGRGGSQAPAASDGGELRDSVAPLLGDALIDRENEHELIALYPQRSFEDLRATYLGYLGADGWSVVPDSTTNAAKVAATLREIGQHDAAALAEQKPIFGASFQKETRQMAVSIDTTKQGEPRVQLSRLS